jgi:hypothetical protein
MEDMRINESAEDNAPGTGSALATETAAATKIMSTNFIVGKDFN